MTNFNLDCDGKIDIDQKLIAIYGPTITKKTGLALNLAKYIWGKYNVKFDLISADSRKIYKDLKIGQVTLFPPYDKKLKIHLTNFLSLGQKFTLHQYKGKADSIIDQAHREKRLPLIFGGTGVYLLSVVENWNIPPNYQADVDYKEQYGQDKPRYKTLILVPNFYKPSLFKAIKSHVEANFQKGICQEVKKLVKKYKLTPLAPQKWNILYETIEYREFLEYAREKQKPLEEFNQADLRKVKARIFTDLKNMARRQISFLKKIEAKKMVASWQEARKLVDAFLVL